MSTTVVAHLHDGIFALVTMTGVTDASSIDAAFSQISMEAVVDDGEIDEIELRASLSSELKHYGLQLGGLQLARAAEFGK